MRPAGEDRDLRAAEDALAHLNVEREERPDGRYVLYFSWPAEGDAAKGDGADGTSAAEDDV
jgi:hypothetical protein